MTALDTGQALLLIADADLLYRPRPLRPDEPITIVTVPTPAQPQTPHTIIADFKSHHPLSVLTRTHDGSRQHAQQIPAGALLDGLRPGPAATDALYLIGERYPTRHAPLFCATGHPDGWHTYSRVHLRADAACFLRTSAAPTGDPSDPIGWIPDAVTRHSEHAPQLNSLDCSLTKAHTGKEIETKFTLPSGTPLWPLAVDLHDRVATGALPDMAPRFRDPLEMWDFSNILFEVHGPGPQRGYVSFLHTRPGIYQVKRKNYDADALVRHEHVDIDVTITEPLNRYVRDTLGLSARPMPSFRRMRYDINFESLRTGHHYGIFVDRCALHVDPTETLVQVEVEYLRSRSVLPLDEPAVFTEVENITEWVGGILTEHSLPAQHGYYSKLSFLRDAVEGKPHLLPPVDKDTHS
ncbi:hypothetical protein [Micromonospora sp. S-DT3-3-22]|uniref:hypothetical protein n=1 Tax=Micromonospora sp. S-DT3-3-22 TaxID=2755359 RepID=UPI00188EF344|nr:hypothetical protein [Micromonospora sp. S-DT3-3-22]